MEIEKQELIYFWLKNNDIFRESLSLNFTNNFDCSYNETSNKLTAKRIKNDDFFGKNITFSVLVGENGTGKSTIIKILNSILDHSKKIEDIPYEFIILFSDGACKTNITFNDVNKFLTSKEIKNVFTGYFDAETAYQKKFFQKDINISSESIIKFMYANYRHSDINKFNIFLFEPVAIELNPLTLELLEQKVSIIFFERLQKNKSNIEENLQKVVAFDYLLSLLNYLDDYDAIFLLYNCIKSEEIFSSILDKIFLHNLQLSFEDLMDIITSTEEKYDEEIDRFKEIINAFYKAEKPLKFVNISEPLRTYISIYPELLDYDFIDVLGRRYSNLSHGEKTIFSLFIHIDELIRDFNRTTCIILLDEPDLSLHPNWQKLFISDLIKNFSNKRNLIQFIITTHSPFILSDMPPGNVTYFRKDSKINKSYIDINISIHNKTFGANIHTLLSDNFFMKNSLLGEFSKKKIEKIIRSYEIIKKSKRDIQKYQQVKQYKDAIEKKLNEYRYIQNITGDDYLSNLLSNYITELEELLLGDTKDEYELKQFFNVFGKEKIKNYLESIND